jgi:membrane protease YdiL (CAAX protease family)
MVTGSYSVPRQRTDALVIDIVQKATSLIVLAIFYYAAWNQGFMWLWRVFAALLPDEARILAAYHWFGLTANHLWMLLLALIGLRVLAGKGWHAAAGLHRAQWALSLRMIGRLCLWWSAGMGLYLTLAYILPGRMPVFSYPLSTPNILAGLAFQWLMVGLTEELFFRGLNDAWLRRFWPEMVHWDGSPLPLAGLIGAGFFALAHVNFTIAPFAVTHFDAVQVIVQFALGLAYATMRQRSGSLLGPILAHSITNGVLMAALFGIARWLG